MLNSTIIKQLTIAAASTAFIVGIVGAAPGGAVTLSFQGNLQSDGTPFQGSVTADDDFLRTFVENNFRGEYELQSFNFPAFDPSGSVSLTVGSTTISSEGLSAQAYVALNQELAISRGFYLTQPLQGFALYIQLPSSCVNGGFTGCTGTLFRNTGYLEARFFPLTPLNVKPVPEPTGTIGEIALGMVGALMLMRKKKIP